MKGMRRIWKNFYHVIGQNQSNLFRIDTISSESTTNSTDSELILKFATWFTVSILYRMYDGEDSKVLHIGCWTHCRRLWVDALPSDRRAMDIIDPIGDMFRNEDLFRMMKLSSGQIKEKDLNLQDLFLNVSIIRWS